MKNDSALLDALEIVEQLNNYGVLNVGKDLQYIIETIMMYKTSHVVA